MTDIKPIVISISYTYTPEEYLEYCKEQGIEPSQSEFEDESIEWFYDDIRYSNSSNFDIKRIEE